MRITPTRVEPKTAVKEARKAVSLETPLYLGNGCGERNTLSVFTKRRTRAHVSSALFLLLVLIVGLAGMAGAQSQPVSVYWDHTTQINSTGTDSHIQLDMPTNLGEGDMILVIVNAHYADNPEIAFSKIPAGFEQVGAPVMDGLQSTAIMGAFWKIADAVEPPHYDFHLNQPANAWEALVVRVVGAHRVHPFSETPAQYYKTRSLGYNTNESGNEPKSIIVPSIPTVPNSIVVAAMTVGATVNAAGDLYLTPPFFSPPGMVEVRNNGDTTGWYRNHPIGQHNRPPGFAVAIEDRPNGGDTGSKLFLIDQDLSRRLGFIFNIQPHYAMGFERPARTPLPNNRLPVNGVTTVEVTVVDQWPITSTSEPVSGVRVSFESNNPDKLQIIGPDEVWTDGLGRARVIVANVDWEPGDVTITAKIDSADVNVNRDDSIDLTVHIDDVMELSPPVAGNSSVFADPLGTGTQVLYANGDDFSTITATARDANNQPVENTLIFFEVTDGSGLLAETWGVTDDTGTFTTNLTSLADGVVEVTAYLGIDGKAGDVIGTVDVTFTAATPTLTRIFPEQGTRDNTVFVTLTGTNFLVDSEVNVSGSGIEVRNVVAESANRLTAYFIIDENADVGSRDVTVTTKGGTTDSVTFNVVTPTKPSPPVRSTNDFDTSCTAEAPCVFEVPNNVFEITFEGWGGGGGGGGRVPSGSGVARGGGGGGYARTTVDVIPGQQFEIVVGEGGVGGNPGVGGETGGSSVVRGAGGEIDRIILHAVGGSGGVSSTQGNGGAGGSANIGDVTYSGGTGDAGGGGGAGSNGHGANGSGNNGGTGGSENPGTQAGRGGNAPSGSSANPGGVGSDYGGGGGGARRSNSGGGGTASGGAGGDGVVRVTYETLEYALTRVSGNNQTGPVTTTLDNNFAVKVTDHNDNWVSGQTITFRVVEHPNHAAGQTMSESTVVTGSGGTAASWLTLGSRPGRYLVFVTLLDPNGNDWAHIAFEATATLGPPAQLEAVVTKDDAVADGEDEVEFTITIKDEQGYPVPDALVVVSDNGDLGSLTGAQALTNESGQAVFVATSTLAGPFTVTFGVDGGTLQDDATATFIGGAPVTLAVTRQPGQEDGGAISGKLLGKQPVVQLRDKYDNVSEREGVGITAVLLIEDPDKEGEYIPAPPELAALQGNTVTTTDETGSATFSDLAIEGEPGKYYIKFESPDLTGAMSIEIQLQPDNQPPKADFEWDPEFPRFGEAIRFTDLSHDPDEDDVLTYAWDFGDESTSMEANPKHTYAQIGKYEVSLTCVEQ